MTTTEAHLTETFDAIVVGARVAGATLGIRLARAGWRVAVVDKATFPSDTLSTHVMFPDGLAELDDLGALSRLQERHTLTPSRYSWRVLGHEVAGAFTPVKGHDRCLSVRRITLDGVLADLAEEAGATMLLGTRVTGLVGTGTTEDPVRGVVLADGRALHAPWVLGADGYRSKTASLLGVPQERQRRGEVAMLLGYWRGLPPSAWCRIDLHERSAIMVTPCEDGLHLLNVAGPPELTRGTAAEVEARYHEALRTFPAVLNPRVLDAAELVSPVVKAPETMMRGFFRRAAGPGWALVGDAGHFKHPTTGQGIGDALAQARFVAEDLVSGGDLAGYEEWRERRSAEPYEFSYRASRFPGPDTATRYAGLAADPAASQAFLDTFTRQTSLAEVFTPERSRRWRAAAAYEDGLRSVVAILDRSPETTLDRQVPACPLWSVRDLVAHLAGVAEDATRGEFYDGATQAWAEPELARRREEWTAGHVRSRGGATGPEVVADLQRHGHALVQAWRRGRPVAVDVEPWMVMAPVADLAAHLEDLREALGVAPEPSSPITRAGFAAYRGWLGERIDARGLPPLRLSDGEDEWVLGDANGDVVTTLQADRHDLFRGISGRRSLAEVTSWAREGDLTPYASVVSPYPLPS